MTSPALPLDDWLARLETYSAAEIELGLERVVEILGRLALTLPKTLFLIGGTNGKGSSVAMLDAIFRESGRKVACYTSPHIHRYNERIRIDGRDADDADIIAAFERVESVRGDCALTYFEFGTLAALLLISEAEVDVAILEVGMGGRLDAVNVVDADACLISNVALDHCEWLGNDIESIAFEKAGIMRRGRPVIYGSEERPLAIDKYAADIGATLVAAGRDYRWQRKGDHWTYQSGSTEISPLPLPSLLGGVQVQNAAGVIAMLEAADFRDCLQADLLAAALGRVRLQGRMQSAGRHGNWIFDVAHNPAAASALADVLGATPVAGETTAVIGVLDDKDAPAIIAALEPVIDRWIAVTPESARARPASDLAGLIANATGRPCRIGEDLPTIIQDLEDACTATDRVLVSGSFFVVGPVLRQLELYSPRLSY